MIYGYLNTHMVRDVTDLIGIRTLVLRAYWAPASGSLSYEEIASQTPPPPGAPAGTMLMGSQTTKERGRYATLWTYQGVRKDGKSASFKNRSKSLDYGFEPGFSQVPIQVHARFEELAKKYGGYPGNDGTTVVWPATLTGSGGGSGGGSSLTLATPSGNTIGGGVGALATEGGGEGAINPMFGIQAFFEMDGIYHFRYAEESLPGSLQAGVGFIAGDLPGQPPKLSDGRDWLKAPSAYQRKGTVFDITEYYWLSRRGGWPKPVYGQGVGS